MVKEIITKIKEFHKKPIDSDEKETIARCAPIAREIVEIIAKCDYPYGSQNWDKISKATHDTVKEILETYLKHNCKIGDVNFIYQLVLEEFNRIQSSLSQSINHSLEFIESEIWGCAKKDADFDTFDKMLKELDKS